MAAETAPVRQWITDIAGPLTPPAPSAPAVDYCFEGSKFCLRVSRSAIRPAGGRWLVVTSPGFGF